MEFVLIYTLFTRVNISFKNEFIIKKKIDLKITTVSIV